MIYSDSDLFWGKVLAYHQSYLHVPQLENRGFIPSMLWGIFVRLRVQSLHDCYRHRADHHGRSHRNIVIVVALQIAVVVVVVVVCVWGLVVNMMVVRWQCW